jgi:hypothetical protein
MRLPVPQREERKELPPVPPVAPSKPPSRTNARPIKQTNPQGAGNRSQQWALLWVGLAIAVGVSMRFLRVPDWVLPLLVGVAVAAVTVVVLVQFGGPQEQRRRPTSGVRRRSGEVKRLARTDGDTNKRLSGLARRVKTASKEGREN